MYFLLVWLPLEELVLKYVDIDYYAIVKYLPELFLYLMTAMYWVVYYYRTKKILPDNPINKWLLGFVGVSLVSLLLNWYSPAIWLLGVRQILRFAIAFYLILLSNYDFKVIRNMIWLGGGMMLFEILVGLAQYLAGGQLDRYLVGGSVINLGMGAVLSGFDHFWSAGQRMVATMGRYNHLGSFLVIGIVILFAWFYSTRDKYLKKYYIIFLFLGILILISTYSRASWLAAILGIVVVARWSVRDKKFLKWIGLTGIIFVIYLSFYAMWFRNLTSIYDKPRVGLVERSLEAVNPRAWRASYEGYGRFYFIVNTPRVVVADSPFFGVGLGNFGGGVAGTLYNTDVYDRLRLPFGIENVYGQIDNSWFSIWGENGTLGLFCWIGMFISLINCARLVADKKQEKYQTNLARGFVGVVPAVMLIGFFGPFFELRASMFYFWMLAGIIVYCWRVETHRFNFAEWRVREMKN